MSQYPLFVLAIMGKPQKSDLKASFELCSREAELALLAEQGYTHRAAQIRMAQQGDLSRTSASAYLAITRALKELLGDKRTLLDLFSGDSLVPVTLAHTGVLSTAVVSDIYSGGKMANVGKALVRRVGVQGKMRFVEATISTDTPVDVFKGCPQTVSMINTGLSVPSDLQLDVPIKDRADLYVTPHYFPLAGENFNRTRILEILARLLPGQTELLFADIVPPSNWQRIDRLEERARSALGEVVSSTPWTVAELKQIPNRAIVVGRLSKEAQ